METAFTFNSWVGLRNMFLILLTFYWLLKLLTFFVQKISRKNRLNKRFLTVIEKLFLLYKPLALLLLLLEFIAINYIVNSIFLLIVGAIGFSQLRSYVSGVLLKLHSLIKKGTIITVGEVTGEIKKLLPLGIIVNTESGEFFISNTTLDQLGFTVSSKDDNVLRQTLYLKSSLSKTQLLDLLFDNPILNFREAPSILEIDNSTELKMQYTLEDGMQNEDLIAFLKEKNIVTSLTNNPKI